MSLRIAIRHHTRYKYDRLTTLYPQTVRLRPAPQCRTPILAYSLKVRPDGNGNWVNWQQDPWGNFAARCVFSQPVRELSIEVDLIAEMPVINPFDFFVEEYAENFPFDYEPALKRRLDHYLELRDAGPLFLERVRKISREKRRSVDFLVDVNQALSRDIQYRIRMEPGIQTCEETLELASGSCRDSAWVLVQTLRHMGLAARFASGYIVQLKPDVKPLEGPAGPEADFTDLHAWAEVFLPGAGWVGLDPTSGLFAGEGHIPLSCTPDPVDAAPVTGATSKCESEIEFVNEVTRIHEDPRVSRPYLDEEWERIEAVACHVDTSLKEGDVRLTLGGEPTFVSVDDMEGDQWNAAALGEDKRRLGGTLLRRLRDRFAPRGMLHFGQGKWYPGEELPRWALSCIWRKDGEPIWNDPDLIAEEEKPSGAGPAEAEKFARELARRLGLSSDHPVPGYEDAYYYLWREGTLPVNVDPLKADLKDPMERRRLAKLLERGLGEVTGYALPLRRGADGWESGKWTFRRGRMYLIPGDSPMGLRLPLDALPSPPPGEDPLVEAELCPLQSRPPLGDIHGEVRRRTMEVLQPRHGRGPEPGDPAIESEAAPLAADDVADPGRLVRTAMCIEPRDGHLYVFLPPFHQADPALDLVAAIEHTAAALKIPVFMEGYTPPRDSRLESFNISPDPGVLEVNMHPGADWEELKHIHDTLFEEARLSRLGTEKFMMDGRHTGTGGGHHITLGGATPPDSPFLRRPDLLRSLVSFWQHHPSLSYLFSSLFIGPTSQAPRSDEGRDDSLHELEIALDRLPKASDASPWIVDRVLRNMLVDITGNTHRAEFSIDKLYSPAGYAGRQGLVEIRCFEMPPHARMSLVQMLLVRALVARFWKEPYAPSRLVRWGTELHDRFMLPHYIREDFRDVIRHLRRGGFEMDPQWFEPFLEFRFPKHGEVQLGDINLELRTALEPWDVLGEEMHMGTTARYVDSSVERVQVKVRGMTDSRHVVACNGRRVPMRPTGRRGEFVAGVRFQAWQPPSSRHPTISVQAPLTFDMIDLWSGRSVGGCTWHVSHPGGLHYEWLPVNEHEAEARRISRFGTLGHTPGPCKPPPEEPTLDMPCTLDLRRSPR